MSSGTLLMKLQLSGPPVTGPLSSGNVQRKAAYRERIQVGVRNLRVCRPVPDGAPLDIRIYVNRRPGRRCDCDNIAKPILDSLGDVLGIDSWGNSNDDRVRRLEVTVHESKDLEDVTIEVHACPHVSLCS